MSDLIQRVRAIRENTWAREPEDIKNMLDKTKGYTDTWDSCFFPTLFAWEETIASRNVFFVIRQSLRQEGLDFKTVRCLARNLVGLYIPFVKWANLPETQKVFEDVRDGIDGLESAAELIELMEELILYTGRLNYWIEPLMPWNDVVGIFDSATS